MGRFPYIPLYTGDWRKDPALTLCTSATRGVWIDLICAMHDLNRSGELRGTAEQIGRIARCSTVEAAQALTELQTTGTADITERNGVYTIRNRRMYAECLRRKSNAERQVRFRNAQSDEGSNAKKTGDPDIDSSSTELDRFEEFWKVFPNGRKKSKGRAREAFEKALKLVSFGTIFDAAKEYADSDEGRGAFVKMPSTWLNGECWNDDRESWRDRGRTAPGAGQRCTG